MRRVVAVFLLATPVWVLCGIGGWWLGSRGSNHEEVISAVAASEAASPAAAPLPAQQVTRAVPSARRILPVKAAAEPPRIAPAPPKVEAPAPADAIASLGSTDPTAPETALTPAPVEAAASTSDGVLIVVSLASQKAFVFKDGELWGSSPVSTGKRGKRTPVGRYTILEKQVHHRSTKYDDAPMPYMQRLTWGGVAMHAGHVTGRPASHGCIRLPRSFAKKLYHLTNFSSTTVVVTDRKARSSGEARKAA